MIFFLVALTLLCWVPLVPMLRDPYGRIAAVVAPEQVFSVPDLTFDTRGFS